MKIAIVIGHSYNSQGAKNDNNDKTEFSFNETVASDLAQNLTKAGIDHEIVYRDKYANLPEKINALNPSHIVSLHCNAFNGSATGTEMLYYHSSVSSKRMAELFQVNVCSALGLKDRGILPRHSEDRGGFLLASTNAPCIICEPFFIDNDNDYKIVEEKYDLLIDAYTLSIIQLSV